MNKQRLQKEEEERVKLYRVKSTQEFESVLQKCKEEGRTPLILSSLESQMENSKIESGHIYQVLQSLVGQQTEIYNIFLRDIGLVF